MGARYDNIGGVQHKVSKRYDNINGVFRPVSKRFSNIAGVWRQGYTAGAIATGVQHGLSDGAAYMYYSGTPTLSANGLAVNYSVGHSGHGSGNSYEYDYLATGVAIDLGGSHNFAVGNQGIKANMELPITISNSTLVLQVWLMLSNVVITNATAGVTNRILYSSGTIAAGKTATVATDYSSNSIYLTIIIRLRYPHDSDASGTVSLTIPNNALSIITDTSELPISFI
nr:MAG TPA: hypothetical protein [Caudoviricetes sp.]